MNKPKNSQTIAVKELEAGNLFVVPGHATVYRCESRYTEGANTRIIYTLGRDRFMFTKPNLSTIYLLGE